MANEASLDEPSGENTFARVAPAESSVSVSSVAPQTDSQDHVMNWLDAKAVIECLRDSPAEYVAAVIPTPSDPLQGQLPSGATASPDVREDGFNLGLLLMKRSGECRPLIAKVAEAVLNDGILHQKGITICLGATSPTLKDLCD